MVNRYRSLGRNARLYLLSNLLQAATTGAVFVVYNLYLTALGYGTDFIGLALLVATIGGGLGIIPANPLVNRLGYRAMLIWSDLVGGVAIAIQILFPTPPIILLTMIGAGASVAVVLVVNTPLLTTYTPPREHTAVLGLNNALGFLFGIVGTLLGGFLPELFGRGEVASSGLMRALDPFLVAGADARRYELAMLAAGLLALPSIVPILLMREERRAVASPPGPPRGAPEVSAPPRPPWRKRLAGWARTARVVGSGVVGRFTVAQTLLGFGAGLFVPFANLYFVKHLGSTTGYYGVLTSITAVAIAGANLLAVWLAARLGKVRGPVVAQSASLAFLVGLAFAATVPLASALFVVRAFLMALTGPPLQAFYMSSVAERSRVMASSVYNVGYQVSAALGAAAGGVLIGRAGFGAAYLAAAPFYAASAVLLMVWFGRPSGSVAKPADAPDAW